MRGSFTLGKIAGIKISLHWTFVLLIMLFLIPQANPESALWSAAFILAIFSCIILHELGHALTAKSYGIMTRDITLLPIGGVASLVELPKIPRQELLISIAGPLVNVAIAVLLYPFVGDAFTSAMFTTTFINNHNFVSNLFAANLTLAAFNLVPAFPMDGGRILRAIISFKMNRVEATRIAATIGQTLAIVFGIIGALYNPLLVFIAVFIFLGAQYERQMVESSSLLSGSTVTDVMMKQFTTFQATDPLSKVIESLLKSSSHDFVIFEGNKLVGTLEPTEIIRALSKRGDQVPISEVMNSDFLVVDYTTKLEDAYTKILNHKGQFLMVSKENSLLGVVDLENILELIMVRQALGKG